MRFNVVFGLVAVLISASAVQAATCEVRITLSSLHNYITYDTEPTSRNAVAIAFRPRMRARSSATIVRATALLTCAAVYTAASAFMLKW